MNKKSICFVSISFSPEILGGTNLFNKNLIKYIQSKKLDIKISWVYFGEKNKRYQEDGINYIELKSPKFGSELSIKKNLTLVRFFNKNFFDVISARTGLWVHLYKKKAEQKIFQTYHGTRYYLNKNHYERLNFIKKSLLLALLGVNWIVDKPGKETDKIICVSKKVKRQVENLYGKRKNIRVIRTGVDLKKFEFRNKKESRKILNLDKEKIYGLYVGNGGFWTKGLDRAINISENIYKKNKEYRLIVIGPDLKKSRHLLNKKFVIYIKEVNRDKMPFYYNAADFFFCMSRYEGGAPTLVISEAMASGCLISCSKSSEQEIIEDGKNGLILENFDENDAERIIEILKNKKKKSEIIKNSIKTIKEFSLQIWGKKYLEVLIK